MREKIGNEKNIGSSSAHDKYIVFFSIVVFIGIFIFFTVVHPLYVYDMDDWTYIMLQRKAIPLWKNWNPTRVFPETLMPLVAELGIRLFMPFNGDYIGSMAIAFALVLSTFYSIYFLLFCRWSSKIFTLSGNTNLMSGLFILLLHFLPFMTKSAGNDLMYIGNSVTTVFYYTIPALLNASLVIFFSGKDCVGSFNIKELAGEPKWQYGVIFLMLYLAVNSNMYQSIILIAYIASVLLLDFIRRNGSFLDFCYKNIIWLALLIAWLLALLMESQGGRAASMQSPENYFSEIGKCVKVLAETIGGVNFLFTAIFVLIFCSSFLLYLFSEKKKTDLNRRYVHSTIIYLLSLLTTTVYLVLVCARTGMGFMRRSTVFSGILFYAMMLMWTALNYIINRLKVLSVLFPIVIYVLFFATIINLRSYREINVSNYKASIVKQISDDILEQVLQADQLGETAIEISVPVFDSGDNWPLPAGTGVRISHTLFVHGLIGNEMEITIVPDYDTNEKYHLK